VIIPEITLRMPERRLERAPECPDYPGLVFFYRGKPVANYYLQYPDADVAIGTGFAGICGASFRSHDGPL
jgi:hypothetical protein